ncbi:MAG TPA: isochorismate synthase [Kofleriaceae bacterium]|nr:isochorismate synthase [Kofleriaceae bacterium]
MLTSALAAPLPAPDAFAVITLPVPEPAPPALSLPDLLFWWAPRDGGEVAGLGVAAEITARGADRFADLERRGAELLARVAAVREPPGAPPWTPRLYGGLAFAPGAADAAPWSDFGDAWFALPRVLYRREGRRAWLSVVVDGSAGAAARERALAEAQAMVASLGAQPAERRAAPAALRGMRQLDPAVWRDRVARIRAAISDGACEKIVYARRTELDLAAPVDARSMLERLDARHPTCFRFAFRRGAALFTGASPERLVARRGDVVESEAMAGSIAGGAGAAAGAGRDEGGAARALLDSGKDRGEQEMVARALVRALSPLCRSLAVAPAPEVRALRDVLHLWTPLRGELARPLHVLELAAALHPTPAVGGEPTAAALAWIAGHEQAPRGWYAGPVGWFDAAGDGELAVAIRSGLVTGERAYAWAGAGIVSESDPEAEYAETGLKQRALLDVLGVEAGG